MRNEFGEPGLGVGSWYSQGSQKKREGHFKVKMVGTVPSLRNMRKEEVGMVVTAVGLSLVHRLLFCGLRRRPEAPFLPSITLNIF